MINNPNINSFFFNSFTTVYFKCVCAKQFKEVTVNLVKK